jgi:hypothetical protein
MEHGMRIPETEVLRRAALLGLGAAAGGRVLELGPAAAQTMQKRGRRRRRAHMPPAGRVRRA